jgi:hypothetical protein
LNDSSSLKAQTALRGRLYLTDAAGTVRADLAETKVNDMHATGDAMGRVSRALTVIISLLLPLLTH